MSLFLLKAPADQPLLRVKQVVAAVSANIRDLQDRLPDLVCNERITSTTFESGRAGKTKVIDSLFSIQRQHEQREVTAVDGKPAKKNSKIPPLPDNITGAFNDVVLATFSPENLDAHDYDLRKPGVPGQLVVQFTTTENQRKLFWAFDGDDRVARDAGTALIDSASMQVVRIERSLRNLPPTLSRWSITVNQGPFVIGEKQFWLPKVLQAEVTRRDSRKSALFVSEYSNCRTFAAKI
jgi:hypothetical protein